MIEHALRHTGKKAVVTITTHDAGPSAHGPIARYPTRSHCNELAPEHDVDITLEPGKELTWTETHDYFVTK